MGLVSKAGKGVACGFYPVERILRDARLGLIWTGTSETMDLIIQHEVYRELGTAPSPGGADGPIGRDVEADAEGYVRRKGRCSRSGKE